MNIAIFGATGATGRILAERSLSAGHQVTVLARTPEKLPRRNQAHVVQGSAFDPEAVGKTIAGADVVLSALGPHTPFRNENVLPRAVPIIVQAMQRTLALPKPIRRIIVLGAAGAVPGALEKQSACRRWVVRNVAYRILKWPVAEQVAQYNILRASSLDWTMVMPMVLSNSAARGTYRVDGEALPPGAGRISRADVADFMMWQIGDPRWIRQGVYISW